MRHFIFRSLSRWLSVGCLLGLFIASPTSGQIADDPFGDLTPGAETPESPPVDPMQELQTEQPKTLEDVLQEGRDLAAAGNCIEAMKTFNAIIAQNPRVWQAQFEKGKCLAELKEIDLAISALSNAAIYGQQVPEVFFERGNLYYETQQYAEAAKDFTTAVQLNPGQPEYLLMRGKALTRQAQQLNAVGGLQSTTALYLAAVSSFDRAIEFKPDYTEAYLERGLTKSYLGESEEAIEDLQAALQREPTANAHARLGFIFLRRGDAERRKHGGDLEQAIGDYSEAIREFDAFIAEKGDPNAEVSKEEKRNPDYIPPQNVLVARAVVRIGMAALSSDMRNADNFQAAIADCNLAMEFDVTDAEISSFLLQRGIAERLNGDLESAIETFTSANETYPANSEVLLRRGIAYYHAGMLDVAEADFRQASEALQSGRVQFWLGAVHARRGEFQESIRFYSQSIRENPGYKPSYSNRGLAYMRLGEFDRAAKDFAVLVRRDGNNSVARSRLEMARDMSSR